MYTQVSVASCALLSLGSSILLSRVALAQLAYDSAFFAFEGQWTYQTNATLITPIGVLQQQARAFSIENGGKLGVHVPAVALMLDFQGGWTRPCDAQPKVRVLSAGRHCVHTCNAMHTYSPLHTRVR